MFDALFVILTLVFFAFTARAFLGRAGNGGGGGRG